MMDECCCQMAIETLDNTEDGDATWEDFASAESTCHV